MSILIPGQLITSEIGYLRGHGSYSDELDSGIGLFSAVAGKIERINKLITIKPIRSRYIGEVGDLVVGRISSIEANRWKVDIHSQKDAQLLLSGVNLPGGVLRMRTHEDQLQMRQVFNENDLISAEIQNIGKDGTVSLHTRSLRYGKLENGQHLSVPAVLIKRLPHHYISLEWGVDLLLGRNGGIWLTRTMPSNWALIAGGGRDEAGAQPDADALQLLRQRHAETPILPDERLRIARTRGAILALCARHVALSPETISAIYKEAEARGIRPQDMIYSKELDARIDELR